jgi:hypothetical protein
MSAPAAWRHSRPVSVPTLALALATYHPHPRSSSGRAPARPVSPTFFYASCTARRPFCSSHPPSTTRRARHRPYPAPVRPHPTGSRLRYPRAAPVQQSVRPAANASAATPVCGPRDSGHAARVRSWIVKRARRGHRRVRRAPGVAAARRHTLPVRRTWQPPLPLSRPLAPLSPAPAPAVVPAHTSSPPARPRLRPPSPWMSVPAPSLAYLSLARPSACALARPPALTTRALLPTSRPRMPIPTRRLTSAQAHPATPRPFVTHAPAATPIIMSGPNKDQFGAEGQGPWCGRASLGRRSGAVLWWAFSSSAIKSAHVLWRLL